MYYSRSLIKTELDSLLYRKFRLKEKFNRIKNLLSGTDAGYVEMILTKSGNYSKTKINRLVNDLIGCLEEYRTLRNIRMDSSEALHGSALLDSAEKEYYEAFYRLIIGLSLYNQSGPHEKLYPSGTWNSILERIEGMAEYDDPSKLFRDLICYSVIGNFQMIYEEYPYRIPKGTCYDIMTAYSELTGSIDGLIPEERKKEAYAAMSGEERELIEKEERYPGTISAMHKEEEELIMNWYTQLYEAGQLFPDDPEIEKNDFDEDSSESRPGSGDDSLKVSEWRRYFSDRKQFLSDCRLVLEKTPELNRGRSFPEEAVNAVELYLIKTGTSRWLEDRDYFTVYTYLDKALRASEKKMRNK